ncbi:MAG: DUF2244 domain-containing protein [Sulfuricaulis sp.]
MDTRYTPEKFASNGWRLLIRPNRSLSPRAMVVLYAVMAAFVMTLGIGFSLVGAWLVLPFAGLEMVLVGAVLYWLYRHVDDHELIIIDNDDVTVIQYRGGRKRSDVFQRYWAKVTLERNGTWYPSRLKLGSHGRVVVIGTDISDDERSELSARLKEALRNTVR